MKQNYPKTNWPRTLDLISIYWALFHVLFPGSISPLAVIFAFGWMVYRTFKTNFFTNDKV